MKEVRVLSATGMLGSGFKENTIKRAMSMQPDFIGADSGSTDPGPYYLGSGDSMFSAAAYKRDLRLMLLAGRTAGVPVIVGSACTSGSNIQLERLLRITHEIAREERLSFRMGAIQSEQDKSYLKQKLRQGKLTPLLNAPPLDETIIDRSAHIVGMAGVEPFIEALDRGCDVIIAGRASDTSIFAALPVMRGIKPASAWHAAKIMECGAACVVQRRYPDCNFAIVRDDHFIIDPPNPEFHCSPESVASHNLYENASPYELFEPSGVLNTREAQYEAISDHAVRVHGSTFRKSDVYTIKLEGAELAGYQSILIGTVRDPLILRQLDTWLKNLGHAVTQRIESIYGTEIVEKYRIDVRVIGKNATMGSMEPETGIGHEVGLLFQVTAETQALATALIKSASHIALHYPIPEWSGLITSIAYPYSPAEIERGATYRFNMNHIVIPSTATEMFPINYIEVKN